MYKQLKTLGAVVIGAQFLVSCSSSNDKAIGGGNDRSATVDKEAAEKMVNLTLDVYKIPQNVVAIPTLNRVMDNKMAPADGGNNAEPALSLDLPDNFVSREFLFNPGAFRDNLGLLIGKVVKSETVNGRVTYRIIQDFKVDTVEITAKAPPAGILIEKKYDSQIGAAIKFLIASASVEKEHAIQLVITDVSEALLEKDTQIDKGKLYAAYHDDKEIDSYSLVISATTTNIYYRDYEKSRRGAGFSSSAVNVGGNYYKENSSIRQDWKVGMVLTPVKELLKGYTPK
jgi:hypothetical protein